LALAYNRLDADATLAANMKFWTHRDYFRTFRLNAAQYGEILIAQVFKGEKLGDSQRCYDVEAQSDALKRVLEATGADDTSPLWPRTDDPVRIEVTSKLSYTPFGGKASVIRCKDSNLDGTTSTPGMTHLAVVIVHPGSRGGRKEPDAGRVVNAWLLTRDAAKELRRTVGTKFIPVPKLEGRPAPDGVISITPLVAAAAEMPLEFLEPDDAPVAPIRKTPGVCGGSACVGNTRIPVWVLWRLREQGLSDEQLLESYPSLMPDGLSAAWEYAARNTAEIADDIKRQSIDRGAKERATA
jgi:uncharacterized protein (DUF433 family)